MQKIILIAILSFWATILKAQEKGNYFITNYNPKHYNAHIQNWAITQTDNNVVLIDNGDTVPKSV